MDSSRITSANDCAKLRLGWRVIEVHIVVRWSIKRHCSSDNRMQSLCMYVIPLFPPFLLFSSAYFPDNPWQNAINQYTFGESFKIHYICLNVFYSSIFSVYIFSLSVLDFHIELSVFAVEINSLNKWQMATYAISCHCQLSQGMS